MKKIASIASAYTLLIFLGYSSPVIAQQQNETVDMGVFKGVVAQGGKMGVIGEAAQCMAYHEGLGVQKDYQQAAAWCREAAEHGDAPSQEYLGKEYYFGLGVPQDYKEAMQWFVKAAAQESPVRAEAETDIGLLYSNGQGVKQDYTEAMKWLTKAAAQNNAKAQFSIGTIYAKGGGVKQDYQQAADWFKMAAEKGDIGAQNAMSSLYNQGMGVPQDDKKSAEWAHRAAEQGDAEAQVFLAGLYHAGQGVPKDDVLSYVWIARAVQPAVVLKNASLCHKTPNCETFIKALDTAAQRLTPEQLAKAQQVAKEWKPKLEPQGVPQ